MSGEAKERSLRIIKNLPYLCSNSSSPEVVITCLVADGVITKYQEDEIQILGTDYKQFKRIYTLVETKLSLSNTYSSLMNALKKAGLDHIVQKLADDGTVDENIQNHGVGQIRTTLPAPPKIKISDYAILADLKNSYTEWMKSDSRDFSSVDLFTQTHNKAQDKCFKTLKDIPAENKNKIKEDLTTFLKAECATYAQKFMQEKQQQLLKDYKKKMNTFFVSNQSRFEDTKINDAHNNEIQVIRNEYDKFLKALPSCIEKKSMAFTSETKTYLASIKDQNNRRLQGSVLESVAATEMSSGSASAGSAEKSQCVMM